MGIDDWVPVGHDERGESSVLLNTSVICSRESSSTVRWPGRFGPSERDIMSTFAKHLAPLSASVLVVTLLLTGCTGSAPEPDQESMSTQQVQDAPAQLNTSVPAAFRPAAEGGNGWQSEKGSNNTPGTSIGLTGDFLFSIDGEPGEGYTFTGIDADSGLTSIEAQVPALKNPNLDELDGLDISTGATTYGGKHYAYVIQAGELSSGESGYQVTFVEAKAGAEVKDVPVPLGADPEQTDNPLTFRDEPGIEVWVATPDGAEVFNEGAPYHYNVMSAPLREDIVGVTADRKPIRVRLAESGDDAPGYIKVGEKTIAKSTGDLPARFLHDGDRFYYVLDNNLHFADLKTYETKKLGAFPSYVGGGNTSPNGRYAVVAGFIHDLETGDAHKVVNDDGQELFIPEVIGDDGIAYGANREEQSASYSTHTKEISLDEETEFRPRRVTSNSTFVMTSDEMGNNLLQGVRKQ